MGRAFSRMVQVTMELAGVPVSPCIITDHRGHSSVPRHDENEWVERTALAIASASGGLVSTTEYLMTAAAAERATILGSITRAFLIGKALAQSDPLRRCCDQPAPSVSSQVPSPRSGGKANLEPGPPQSMELARIEAVRCASSCRTTF